MIREVKIKFAVTTLITDGGILKLISLAMKRSDQHNFLVSFWLCPRFSALLSSAPSCLSYLVLC